MAARLVASAAELVALAAASGDDPPFRQDEPYRPALAGVYARLAASARALCGYVPPREPHAPRRALPLERGLRAALEVIAHSLANHGSAAWPNGGCSP